MVDLHNHTPYCHHAHGAPGEFIDIARGLGLREYGFSEHSPWMFQYPGEKLAPTWEEFREYLKLMETLRESCQTDDFKLRIGVELDFIPGYLTTAQKFTANYPFDYVIGSIHNLGTWIFDHPHHLDLWQRREIDAVYIEYFEAMREMLSWGFIDIIGHLDLPKKFGHLPDGGYVHLVEELIPAINDAGCVVEINTAGRDKPIGEFYPSIDIVKVLAAAGVPFTIGSDAHQPSEVGRYNDDARRLLRECGVTEIITFDKKKKIGIPI